MCDAVLSCGKWVPVFCRNISVITDVRPQTLRDKYCFKITCIFKVFSMLKMGALSLAARSKAWTAFARSNTGVMGSNSTRGMDVCVYSVFVLSCVKVAALRQAHGTSKESYGMCTGLRNWIKSGEDPTKCCRSIDEWINEWRWRQQALPKRWYLAKKLHRVTYEQTVILTFTTVRTSNLKSFSPFSRVSCFP
jgi:hypothetical protein